MARQKTHGEFIEALHQISFDIEVLGTYINSYTPISVRCKIDGYEWSPPPHRLLQGSGCPVCSNYTVMQGVNDIPTTDSWMIPYFQGGYDEAKLYTSGSMKKIYPICPDCGRIKHKPMLIRNIRNRHSIACVCSDGVSYPNKFAYAFLNQLPIVNWEPEYSPTWAKPYRYDNYFEYKGQKYILEMDGGIGHGNKKIRFSERDVDGLQTDRYKETLAYAHGIHIIRIDCLHSDREYIQRNILNNEILMNIVNNSCIEIDWDYCDIYAHKNILKDVCLTWNNGEVSVVELTKIFKLSKCTIRSYLKQGSRVGFCQYDIFAKLRLHSKSLICDEKYAFASYRILDRLSVELFGTKIHQSSLSRQLANTDVYKGIKFREMSYKEFFEYYLKHPELCFVK